MGAFTPEQREILKMGEETMLAYMSGLHMGLQDLTEEVCALQLILAKKGMVTGEELEVAKKEAWAAREVNETAAEMGLIPKPEALKALEALEETFQRLKDEMPKRGRGRGGVTKKKKKVSGLRQARKVKRREP